MYFSKFNKLQYTLDNGKSYQVVTDILTRVAFRDNIVNNTALYDEYDVIDGQTPEILAAQYYGNSNYHWIILLTNQIIDPVLDWPMSQGQLTEYCNSKYTNIYATHHYENADGIVVNSDTPFATPITNYDHETAENEKKRRIKLIRKAIIAEVVSEFSKLIKQ